MQKSTNLLLRGPNILILISYEISPPANPPANPYPLRALLTYEASHPTYTDISP
jgi:hypothetical protein